MKKACVLYAGILLLAASPVLAGDEVVARVGSEPVTRAEVETAAAQNPALSKDRILSSIIERRLVLVWAGNNNIAVSEEEIDGVQRSLREENGLTPDQFEQALREQGETVVTFRENLREQLLINRALGFALQDKLNVSGEELEALYRESYPARETFTLRHILLEVGQDAPEEEALAVKARAEEILERIRAGTPFDLMVREHSQDTTSADTGGTLGTFRSGELLPQLEKTVLSLSPGEAGGPVRTSAGYHLVLLVSRGTEEPPPFPTVRDRLMSRLRAEKEAEARNRWLQELRDETYVEIFDE